MNTYQRGNRDGIQEVINHLEEREQQLIQERNKFLNAPRITPASERLAEKFYHYHVELRSILHIVRALAERMPEDPEDPTPSDDACPP
jgi:hypothetical protein